MAEEARFLLNTLSLTGVEQTDGLTTQILSANGYNPLGKIRNVIETDYLGDTQWALIPARGAIRGNQKFYTMGQPASTSVVATWLRSRVPSRPTRPPSAVASSVAAWAGTASSLSSRMARARKHSPRIAPQVSAWGAFLRP